LPTVKGPEHSRGRQDKFNQESVSEGINRGCSKLNIRELRGREIREITNNAVKRSVYRASYPGTVKNNMEFYENVFIIVYYLFDFSRVRRLFN